MKDLFNVPATEPDTPDLPPLQGTPRQVGWAEAVRKGKLADVDRLLREWREYIHTLELAGKTERAEAERPKLRAALDASERLLQRDTCRYWLSVRDNTARELLNGDEAKPGDGF